MKGKISIQVKAGLLFIVFAMNTIIGFGCAMGVDMGFKANHHDEEQTIKNPVHVHADGKKHVHNNKTNVANHHEEKSPEKGSCCNDEVVKFQNAEKNLTSKLTINAAAYVATPSTYFGVDLFNVIKACPQKSVIRFFYPPPLNILTSIQKFQV